MPFLGSSNSAANKDMMSKLWTNRGFSYLIECIKLKGKKKRSKTYSFGYVFDFLRMMTS